MKAHASTQLRGHFEVLKWLRSEGCPWDRMTCHWIAMRGARDLLQWAIDNGCPYEINAANRKAFESIGLA